MMSDKAQKRNTISTISPTPTLAIASLGEEKK